jgi:lipid A 3-O-deacylase
MGIYTNLIQTPLWAAGLAAGLLDSVCGRGAETFPLSPSTNAIEPVSVLEPARPRLWVAGVGSGFLPGVEHVGLVAGAGFGMVVFGSSSTHDLALGGLSYGQMWGGVKAEGTVFRGNWEWRLEAIGGAQFYPDVQYLVGFSPHLRYNLATGTRWVPFFDLGAGLTSTDIGPPDLGGRFQFNLQAGAGLNYFLQDNLALSAEYRFLHLSSARINTPNLGVNSSLFLAGVNWFF